MTIKEMSRRRAKGDSYQAIANDAGISKQRVHYLLNSTLEERNAKQRERRHRLRGIK